jgi:hypothetical protein
MKDTVKTMIPVAVEEDGSNFSGRCGNHMTRSFKLQELEAMAQSYGVTNYDVVWVKAELPIPEQQIVKGECQ